MSWEDILKVKPDKTIRFEGVDKDEVGNNFDIDGWPKYTYLAYQNYMHGVGRIGHEVALIYEYQSNGKYRLVNPHFTVVIQGAQRERDFDKNDAWSLFDTMAADADVIRRDYRGTKALKELEGGGALEIWQRAMPESDKDKYE